MTRIRPAAVFAFIVIACGLGWLVSIPLWLGDGLASPLAGLIIPTIMFTPAIAVVLVILIFRQPVKGERLQFLGIWPLRPAKRVIWLSVLGLFAPAVLIFASVLVAGAVGWVSLDFVSLSGFTQTIEATLPDGVPLPPPWLLVIVQLLTIPFAAATINAVLAFGEEIGWRGFLLPALRPLGTWPALLISGAVWGLWHAPIVLLGYNFGRTDITGVLLMVAGCVLWGVLLGWLRLRSASVWPAVFAHGAINASAAMIALFIAADSPLDMALAGPLGVAGWVVVTVVIIALVLSRSFNAQPELDGGQYRMLSQPRHENPPA